jgi:tryptophan synthase beta subunit
MPLIPSRGAYEAAKATPLRRRDDGYFKNYVGRPSPLYFAHG